MARRGRRSGWCVPRVHARIVDSRFGCRVRSRRRGGWGARRPSSRAGARVSGSFPGCAQPRASRRARKGRTARDARSRHPRAHDRDREKRIARSRRDRNGGGRRNARWVCASRNVCVEAFICLVTREPSGRARRGALDARPMRARIGNGGDELGEKNASTFLALRAHRNYRCRIRNGECARVERGILFRETGCKFTNNACENAGRRDSFARALPSYFEVRRGASDRRPLERSSVPIGSRTLDRRHGNHFFHLQVQNQGR